MRKIFTLLLFAASMACADAFAGDYDMTAAKDRRDETELPRRYDWYYQKEGNPNNKKTAWGRKNAIRVGYVSQKLKPEYGGEFKSEMGFFFANRRSYYIASARKPIGGVLRFAIDWGFDANYVKYKGNGGWALDYGDYGEGSSSLPDGYEPGDYDEDLSGMEDIGLHHIDVGLAVGPSVVINPVDLLRVNAYFHFVPSYSGMLLDESFSHGFLPAFSGGCEVSWKVIGLGVEARFGKAKYKNIEVNEESEDGVSNSSSKFSVSAVRTYLSFRF